MSILKFSCLLAEWNHLSQETADCCSSHTSMHMWQFYFDICICISDTDMHAWLEWHSSFAAFLAELFFFLNVIHCYNLRCSFWMIYVCFFLIFSLSSFSFFNTYHRCTTIQTLVSMVVWCIGLVHHWGAGTSVT